MLEYRYLVTTLGAVFIALGAGIALGGLVAGGFVPAPEAAETDAFYEPAAGGATDTAGLAAEAAELRAVLADSEQFNRVLTESLLAGRLAGKRLGLVVTGEAAAPSELEALLIAAGAEIVSRTEVMDLSLADAAAARRVSDFYGLAASASPEALRTRIGSSVGVILGGQYSQNTLNFLQELGVLRFSGDYSQGLDGVLVLGGVMDAARDWSGTFDAGMLTTLLRLQPNVVGAELSAAAISYMPLYQAYGADTVDNADQAAGRFACVLVLDQASGHFGRKAAADALVPAWVSF
jgi:hypothetical protein